MTVTLRGSSASALTAGILLLSRARGFGQRLQVEILGNPDEIAPVMGPAVLHSAVLASCGVGRELGSGALVIVPGPATQPLAVSLSAFGETGWFPVDRTGGGHHPATREFVALCRARDPQARELGRKMRVAMDALGCSPEPAVLELLFASPTAPLMRLALALRAGREMTGGRGNSVTRYLDQSPESLPDPLSAEFNLESLLQMRQDGRMQMLLDRLRLGVRDPVEAWVEGMVDQGERYGQLLCALTEVYSHLAGLPPQGMLAPLLPSMDAVAVGLSAALGATDGNGDASQSLLEIFRFLGGRFTSDARHPIELPGDPAPDDRLARWQWLCVSAHRSAQSADALWRRVVDPPQ
ncbi:MAG: hypothetical protein AAFV53_13995 [Myxococcota bacterium]